MDTLVVAIDVGGTMIKGALLNHRAELIQKAGVPTRSADDDTFLGDVVALIGDLTQNQPPVSAVGIGIAGVIDPARETLLEAPNLPELNSFPLKRRLEQKIKMPVLIENDANVAALGELWAGAGKGTENFLMFTLGTGIGSGLILNGRLWSGELGKAGEFGHITVETDGARCSCGKRGCLEAYSSGTAIVRMAREALAKGRSTSLTTSCRGAPEALTPELVYNEARQGDPVSLEIYKTAARYLAVGVAGVNNLLDIHMFVVGGGVGKSYDLIEDDLYAETRSRVFSGSKDKIKFTVSRLGNDAGAYGAAYLALSRCGEL